MTQEQKDEFYETTERKYRMFFWLTVIFLTQMLVLTVTYSNKQKADSQDTVTNTTVTEEISITKK